MLGKLLLLIGIFGDLENEIDQGNSNNIRNHHNETVSNSVCTTESCKWTAVRIKEYIDPSARPCDDFYRFACGNFSNKENVASKLGLNSVFTEVTDKLTEQLKAIVSEPINPEELKPYKLMKRLYQLCMDEDALEERGIDPALHLIREAGGWPVLGGWKDKHWNFIHTELKLDKLGLLGKSLFSVNIIPDLKNGSMKVLSISEPSLSPLGREYLIKGMESPSVQALYKYIVNLAMLFGADKKIAEAELRQSLLFNIELAKITRSSEEQRKVTDLYNPFTLRQLKKRFAWIHWVQLFKGLLPRGIKLKKNEHIIIDNIQYFEKLPELLQKYSSRVIANYMFTRVASDLSRYTVKSMRVRLATLRSMLVGGVVEGSARWMSCINIASNLNPAMSSLYVKKYFKKSTKVEASNMVAQVMSEMYNRIHGLTWMDNKTKEEALFKLSKIKKFVAYPEELLSENTVESLFINLYMNTEHYLEAVLDVRKWSGEDAMRHFREPVKDVDWITVASMANEVNAFYSPTDNYIQLTAAILQPPFYIMEVPKYVNYARIGLIIGHEIMHAFDDLGGQFDAEGNMRDWWDEKSKMYHREETQCVIDLYNGFKEKSTKLHLNGIISQGENIADIVGFSLAYSAYRKQMKASSSSDMSLPGLQKYSNDQLFVLSMANMWCTQWEVGALKRSILTGTHVLPEFRVNGVLMNIPMFSQLFNCQPGDKMVLKNRCNVW